VIQPSSGKPGEMGKAVKLTGGTTIDFYGKSCEYELIRAHNHYPNVLRSNGTFSCGQVQVESI